MKKISLALVGAGEIAQNFHLPVLSKLPFVKLVAICDKNKSKAQILAQKYGIPYVCNSTDDLLHMDALEAVDICTNTEQHYDIALSFLEAGKNVLIEKPVSFSLKETLDIAEKSEKFKSKLMVGMNHRFRSDARMLKNYIIFGEVGEVFYTSAGWFQKKDRKFLEKADAEGRGVLNDLGISLVDLILWLNEFSEIKSVQVFNYKQQTKNVEDVCVASLRFRNGSTAHMEVSWSMNTTRNNFYCNVFGSAGSAQLNPLHLQKSTGEIIKQSAAARIHNKVALVRKSFESEIKHFINAVLGLSPVVSTVREAATIMRIIELMYQSAREEREIELDLQSIDSIMN